MRASVKYFGLGAALGLLALLAAGNSGPVSLAQGQQEVQCPPTQPNTFCTLRGHIQGVGSVTFSPDGKLLASSSALAREIKLWEMPTGAQVLTIRGHRDYIYQVSFSPDGKLLASGACRVRTTYDCAQGEVKLWEVETGKEVRTFRGHTSRDVMSVDFSPDKKFLASVPR